MSESNNFDTRARKLLITKFIYRLKILPRWVIILIDVVVIGLSSFLGYLLRFNFSPQQLAPSPIWNGILLYAVCGLFSVIFTGSYRGIVRYTGLQDSVRILYAALLNAVLVIIVNLAFYYVFKSNIIPYSVILISLSASFLFLFNYRILVKYIFALYNGTFHKKFRVIIFGAGQTGIITRHVIEAAPRMEVIGFLEDDYHKIGKVLDGIRIFGGSITELEDLLVELRIDEMILSPKKISLERKNELVDLCIRNQIKVRTVPPIEKWANGELNVNQIKEINIEDLLGRIEIKLDNPLIEREIKGSKILVTGAAGSIGSELVRQLLKFRPQLLILVDQAESPLHEIELELLRSANGNKFICFLADITNVSRIESVFKEYSPDLVYHAAAYKHVPMMENNPSESINCNVLGTKVLADLAVKFNVKKFVMISTDKAVNPTNVMGCSKRIAEIYVQSLNNYLDSEHKIHTAFVTTRFGNVLGSNGSVIPLFKKQILQGGPVTITHPEITRYFMTIPEASQLVLEASIMGKGGEIFIFDMGKAVKIVDLAKKMISLSGLKVGKDLDIIFTGLREGEKLYEELLGNAENSIPTHHDKIMIAKVEHYSYLEVNGFIELFNDLIYDKNELKMVALMKEIVPEFKSNYSRFEVLDR